jgi:hypothetical protein
VPHSRRLLPHRAPFLLVLLTLMNQVTPFRPGAKQQKHPFIGKQSQIAERKTIGKQGSYCHSEEERTTTKQAKKKTIKTVRPK